MDIPARHCELINLPGKVTSEDTLAKYGDYIGGAGLGYKVLWDEVPTV